MYCQTFVYAFVRTKIIHRLKIAKENMIYLYTNPLVSFMCACVCNQKTTTATTTENQGKYKKKPTT